MKRVVGLKKDGYIFFVSTLHNIIIKLGRGSC